MNKTRVEAFSDAVIAIIMTIMILKLKPSSGCFGRFDRKYPIFLSFIVSFIFICIAWYNHHYIMSVTHWFSKKRFGQIIFGYSPWPSFR